ncbi:MAG: GNAT family N-acetyltransferase [Gemmatimonadota bacterium]
MTSAVALLSSHDAADVVDVLCEAFRGYPVMRFVLGTDADYDERLRKLVGLFVAARALREDPMFGIRDGQRLVGVITTSNPAAPPAPAFAALRDAIWDELGTASKHRYDACVQAWTSLESKVPQLHVNMIGVRDRYRGTGLARRLLDEIQTVCERSGFAEGVSLTTEVTENVRLYQHLGYDVIGETDIAGALKTWSLFRQRAR